MAIIDENTYLGTSFATLFIFLVCGSIISALITMYLLKIKKVQPQSVEFQLSLRLITLFLPISWIGLTIGSNFGDEITLDSWINLAVTCFISIVIIILLMNNILEITKIKYGDDPISPETWE
ncbi:MAG: hypothetical protein INQ03_09485 [Candidatus Heimdallarchaeota archaeon]|nr:hypothetical protein [Candidatus Heimdallarchaeota archaeon]